MSLPVAKKVPSVRKFGLVDGELRGTDQDKLINPPIELVDNYFWMRDDTRTNPEIVDHISKENAWTDHLLESNKDLTKALYSEVKAYVRESYDTYAYRINNEAPWRYFRRFVEGKDYPNYWRKNDTTEQELLDVNTLAEGKKQCDVTSLDISPDHKYVTYGVDYDGSELYEFIMMDIDSKEVFPTPIPKLSYCSYFWVNDHLIYYLVGDKANRLYQLWYYDVASKDNQLVFEETNPDCDLSADLTSDKQFIVLSSGNYDANWCKYIDWKTSLTAIHDYLTLLPATKYSMESHNDFWYIHTNYQATNWQVLRASKSAQDITWERLDTFLPANDVVHISSFTTYENFFTFKTRVNGNVYVNITDADKQSVKVLTHLQNNVFSWEEYSTQDFANIKSEQVFSIGFGYNYIYSTSTVNVTFNSMTSPAKIFDYDVHTLDCVKVYEDIVPNYSEELYESKRLWVGQEGTRLGVPVSIIYRKDLFKSDGSNPLYLYGYGSYGLTINADYSYKVLPLLDRGFVYAIAHIRGGAFLGYDWYEDGRMDKKLNTFKDFIRCADYFRDSGMIDGKKIVIEGRSAGGLLIGSCITMRPDLYWVALPGVPFVDLLNTMSDSTIPLTKEEWTQWGNPNELQWFEYMRQYCPYSNVVTAKYPHMYCTAGLHDPRVPYWEILKLVAKIREHKQDDNVQVIRLETSQGHFGGSSRYKYIEELAEKYTFVLTR